MKIIQNKPLNKGGFFVKLSTKLKISFFIMIILPIMLCCLTIGILMKHQAKNISEFYGIDDISAFANMYTPISLLTKMTTSLYVDMKDVAVEYPNLFENKSFLNGYAEIAHQKLSTLIVRKNGVIIYSSSKMNENDLYQMLPKFGDAESNSESGTYYGGEFQSMVKQLDFTDINNNYFSVSIVTSVKQIIPQIKLFVTEGIIIVFLVLLTTSSILIMWIYKSVIKPLARLKLATQNIKEGNLDFEMPIEGDDEIAYLCHDFEEMRVILSKTTQEKVKFDIEEKELISNISHDLRTPLTAIKGYVEGLMDGVADTPQKREKYLKTIFNKVNDMDTLINELTIYSKIDTNRIPYVFKRISINEYFDDCYHEIGMDLEAKGIELKYCNHANSKMYIIADAEQLKRVINNIVSNAVKYLSDRKGRIKIDVYDKGDYVHIRIEDNGKGISKEDLPHIFERFYRADSSRNSAQGGSGIGLAIVKKIIIEHNGNIWAESKENIGTVMHLELLKEDHRDE